MKRITAKQFRAATGVDPEQDDLARCNCKHGGETGHWFCGWDEEKNLPVFWPKIPQDRVRELFDEMRRRQMN